MTNIRRLFNQTFQESEFFCYNKIISEIMKDVLNNFQTFIRRFLIIGVITGLFFSSGEGIRLLPFPATFVGSEKNTDQKISDVFKSYSFSDYNYASHSRVIKLKDQKNFKFFDSDGLYDKNYQPLCALVSTVKKIYHQPFFLNNSIVLISPSDRGPPLVQS